MKQYKIDNVPVFVMWDRDRGCFAAWTDADEPMFVTASTEQQAVNALKAKMFNAELTPEAEKAYNDYFEGRPIGREKSAEPEPPVSQQHEQIERFGRAYVRPDAKRRWLSRAEDRGDWS